MLSLPADPDGSSDQKRPISDAYASVQRQAEAARHVLKVATETKCRILGAADSCQSALRVVIVASQEGAAAIGVTSRSAEVVARHVSRRSIARLAISRRAVAEMRRKTACTHCESTEECLYQRPLSSGQDVG